MGHRPPWTLACVEFWNILLTNEWFWCLSQPKFGLWTPSGSVHKRYTSHPVNSWLKWYSTWWYCTILTISLWILKICRPRWPINFLLRTSDLKWGLFLWLWCSVKVKSQVQLSKCQGNISKMEFCQPLLKPVSKPSYFRIACIALKVMK